MTAFEDMNMAIDVRYPRWIIFKNGFEFPVTDEEAEKFVQQIADGANIVIIRGTPLGNDVAQILTTDQLDSLKHTRKGDWLCRYGTWHSKKEADWECMCGRSH